MKEVIQTYRYKIRNLSKSNRKRLDEWLDACVFVYNKSKELKEYEYKTNGVNLSRYDLHNQLPILKKKEPWLKDVPSQILQAVNDRVDLAFKAFFKKNAGYPRWARKGKYNTMTIKQPKRGTKYDSFRIPKMGDIRTFYSRCIPENAHIKTYEITKKDRDFYISVNFSTPMDDIVSDIKLNNMAGIDMGVKNFISTSDGWQESNLVEALKPYYKKIVDEQRKLSKKIKGSKNWQKQKKILRRAHEKLVNVRKDYQHKLSTKLVERYDLLAFENLDLKCMLEEYKPSERFIKKHRNRLVSSCGFGNFIILVKYKSNKYNKIFSECNPAYTSQTCSYCGGVDSNSRVTRDIFKCTTCGYENDADINAAINILHRSI